MTLLPSPDPSGAGGLAINNNFKVLADRFANLATSDPGTTATGYAPGARWLNTANGIEWICTSTTGASTWVPVGATAESVTISPTGSATGLTVVPGASGTGRGIYVNGNSTASGELVRFENTGDGYFFSIDNDARVSISGQLTVTGVMSVPPFVGTVGVTQAGRTGNRITLDASSDFVNQPSYIRMGNLPTTGSTYLPSCYFESVFVNDTASAYTGRMLGLVCDHTGTDREFMRAESDGTQALLGFFGATAVAKPTVTGSKGGNAALGSLISALAGLGLVTDSTT